MENKKIEDLGMLLEEIYKELDVPLDLLQEGAFQYNQLGEWLKVDCKNRFQSDSSLYVQGSKLLGTSVKPINPRDDFDFDLVYLRNISKGSISQDELKAQVGDQLKRYLVHLKNKGETILPKLFEKDRCWTLQWENKFHMDILPALPDDEGKYPIKNEEGILISDKNLRNWLKSNPKGYAAWFRNSMVQAFNEERERLAKASGMEIEEVPEEELKTTLQRSIQILKRHRDLTFKGPKEDKPVSIIINTLATNAYKNSTNLYLALKEILEHMDHFIEKRNGIYWVPNPINPSENFADKWEENPQRRIEFMDWLWSAKEMILYLESQGEIQYLSESLKKSLGEDVVTNAMQRFFARQRKRARLEAAVSSVTIPTQPYCAK